MFARDPSLTSSGSRSIWFEFHYCSPQLSFKSVSTARRGGRTEERNLSRQRFGSFCVLVGTRGSTEGANVVISLNMTCGVLLK